MKGKGNGGNSTRIFTYSRIALYILILLLYLSLSLKQKSASLYPSLVHRRRMTSTCVSHTKPILKKQVIILLVLIPPLRVEGVEHTVKL